MAAIVSVFFLAFLVTGGLGASIVCPHHEVLFPCSCKRMAFGMQLVCANFNSSEHLIKAMEIMKDFKVSTILLHGLNIREVIRGNLFDGVQVKEMRVEKSILSFSNPPLSGLDSSLSILNVAQQSMIARSPDVGKFSLAKLTKLNDLSMEHIHLTEVADSFLNDKVPNVQKVVLDNNEITKVEAHAFAKLMSLTSISLAQNSIQEVQRSMFPNPAYKLQLIDLSYNKIRQLPEDFFVEMPMLKTVKFSQNSLTTLAEVTWSPVWEQLSQILLFDNPFVCDDKVKWIKDYRRKDSTQLLGTCALPEKMNGRALKDIYQT